MYITVHTARGPISFKSVVGFQCPKLDKMLRRVRANTIAVEKQYVLHIPCICSLSHSACNAHAPILSSVVFLAVQYFPTLSHKLKG